MQPPIGHQSIRCSVKSCSHHDKHQDVCDLQGIQVSAVPGKACAKPDESMCASYEH